MRPSPALLAAALASAFLLCPAASAAPLCYGVSATGTPVGDVSAPSVCVPYPLQPQCFTLHPTLGTLDAVVGVVTVYACLPA